jgi:hypothetical protein
MKNKIEKSWIDWARKQTETINHGGFLLFENAGAYFQIDKVKKTLTLFACRKSWLKDKTRQLNDEVFEKIGYKIVNHPNIAHDTKSLIKIVTTPSFLPSHSSNQQWEFLFRAASQLFNSTEEQIKKLMSDNKTGKIPVNPLRLNSKDKEGEFTASRMWSESAFVPDAPIRYTGSSKNNYTKNIIIFLSNKTNLSQQIFCIISENDFINALHELQRNKPIVKVWGQGKDTSEIPLVCFDLQIRFSKVDDIIEISFNSERYSSEELSFDFNEFLVGLDHLFTDGEIHV